MLTELTQIEGVVPVSTRATQSAEAHRRAVSSHKKVVLLLPPYSGLPLGPPAGLLSLASPLRKGGFDVRIIDGAVTPDYLALIEREIPDALCLGVSLLTGPMIDGAVTAGRLVKQLRPELPVVFGGWHPSLLPEQTLRESFVDAVVRHQGEITFLEMVRRFQNGEPLDGIAGCWFKKNGHIQQNPDRAVTRIRNLPPPAYDQADFDAYERASGSRKLPYAGSVGCPYACSYCTDTVFYNRRFNAYPAERVVEELTRLVRRYRIEEVSFLDSNFLVDTKRAVRIARGFLDSGIRFRWTFQASTDLFCRLTDEEVELLGRSGLSHIGFGTESGSERVLSLMNKPHQTIPDMFESARKAHRAAVRLTFNLIFGYPGETEEDRRQTLRVMADVARRYDNVTFSPNLFTPYPGIPAWPELEARGVQHPDSLEGWKDMALGAGLLPWMKGEPYERLRQSMSLFLLANEMTKTVRRARSRPQRWFLRTLRLPLSWRLRHQFYRWPLEVWLYRVRKRLVIRRSLLTGEQLGHSMDHAC